MRNAPALNHIASRAAANLVAIAAISAIFGLKAYIDTKVYAAEASETDARIAAITALTER